MSLSNIYLFVDVSVTAALRQPFPFFRAEEELLAIDWLKTNVEQGEVVLAAAPTGNYLAGQASQPVVLGHWAETVDFVDRWQDARQFYSAATSDDWRQSFLDRYGVSYVWYGPQERLLGAFNPDQTAFLTPIFQGNEISIFSVQ